MSEQDYGKILGQMHRARDLYRVHDSSGKQKKQRKDQDEKEFLDQLEESERNLEEYKQEEPKEQDVQNPRMSMLDRLSQSAPPPVIEEDEP